MVQEKANKSGLRGQVQDANYRQLLVAFLRKLLDQLRQMLQSGGLTTIRRDE